MFTPLASSSSGNAYIVSDGCTQLLVECGLAFRTLQQKAGFKVTSLDGCLISHEHKDHSRCVDKVIQSGIPVYMSQGTARALDLPEALLEMANEMAAGQQFSIGSMDICPFPTFHDTEEPLGVCIRSRADCETLAFAIDTCNIPYNFPGVNILAVEANYDKSFFRWLEEEVIEDDDSLDAVKRRQMRKRIKRTQNTHMGIDKLCECLSRMDLRLCREIWLMHLSDQNSNEDIFVKKVKRVVPPGIQVRCCPK